MVVRIKNKEMPKEEVVNGIKKSATLLIDTSTLNRIVAVAKIAAKTNLFINQLLLYGIATASASDLTRFIARAIW